MPSITLGEGSHPPGLPKGPHCFGFDLPGHCLSYPSETGPRSKYDQHRAGFIVSPREGPYAARQSRKPTSEFGSFK